MTTLIQYQPGTVSSCLQVPERLKVTELLRVICLAWTQPKPKRRNKNEKEKLDFDSDFTTWCYGRRRFLLEYFSLHIIRTNLNNED